MKKKVMPKSLYRLFAPRSEKFFDPFLTVRKLKSPELQQFRERHKSMYAAAQLMIDPTEDTEEIAGRFTELVFGDREIGKLMKAFEIVPGWGYESTGLSKAGARNMLTELIEHLCKAEGYPSQLPIFPSAEEYRQILLWHADNFVRMLGENPDREGIRKAYWEKALSIYDKVPKAVDERSEAAAFGYSRIGL